MASIGKTVFPSCNTGPRIAVATKSDTEVQITSPKSAVSKNNDRFLPAFDFIHSIEEMKKKWSPSGRPFPI